MFKNIVYSMCCTVLLCEVVTFEDVIGMRPRSNSLPVTAGEIREAMGKYAHLVPASTEKTASVNDTLKKAIIRTQLTDRPEGLENLVTLICGSDFDYLYANYAYMVFTTALHKCHSEVVGKLGRMLAAIAHGKSSGGAHPDLYWQEYRDGYYNPPVLPVDDEW